MKQSAATLLVCAFGAVAGIAFLPPETSSPTLYLAVEAAAKLNSDEAIQTGVILLDVAQEIYEELSESGEDFLEDLWDEVEDAIEDAGKKIIVVAGNPLGHLKKKAKEEAVQILGKIFSQVACSHAAEDIETKRDCVRVVCKKITEVGERLIEEGKRLGGHYKG
ncbi:uncharacterized protein LOC144123181 [Amblyomma americanum]